MIDLNAPTKHGGILIPLDPFRISHLAGVAAELLVSKARNITDAKLVLTRHPQTQLVLGRIVGSVVGDDPVEFWRENADIAVALSQVLPRQCFMYYVLSAPPTERREAFLIAQRGQVLAADEASPDRPPSGEENWPVAKLCEQLRLDMGDLASGFAGGPSVEVSLLEPTVDDQALLMTLAGQPPGAEGDEMTGSDSAEAAGGPGGLAAGGPAAGGPAAGGPAKPATAQKPSVADDLKRREKERAAEEAEMQRRAQEVESDVRYAIDALGIISCPQAELSEPDILAPFVVSSLTGDLPPGLPRDQANALQGKRCDIALRVDFLSEVFVESVPLSRPMFDQRAEERTMGGQSVKVLEVLAPRLGYGSFISRGKAPHVFVSRKPDQPLPEELVVELLG